MADWYLSDGHGERTGPFTTDALIAQPGFSRESLVRLVGTGLKSWARADSFPELADRPRTEGAESEATSAEKGPPTEAVATPVPVAETAMQRIARRYSPVYNMARTLDFAQGLVAVVGGVAAFISLLVGLSYISDRGSDGMLGAVGFAVAVMVGMWTAAVWFGLAFAAAMLRISADVAVDLAPGLSDDEKLSLHL